VADPAATREESAQKAGYVVDPLIPLAPNSCPEAPPVPGVPGVVVPIPPSPPLPPSPITTALPPVPPLPPNRILEQRRRELETALAADVKPELVDHWQSLGGWLPPSRTRD
jgi:hypothetical protein